MKRVNFTNKGDLKDFFNEIKTNSKLSWNKIAHQINTNRSMLDNYRKRKILLPEPKFDLLVNFLNQSRKTYFIDKTSKKDENWGQIKGGLKAYSLNKKHFDAGRNKVNAMNKVKYEFDINMPLSEELCEFLGVIIGDGCTNKYKNLYQTQIAGDKLLDNGYYTNNLIPICERLFGISPKIVIRPKGIYLNIYSKRVFELLTQRFSIPRGIKCYSVRIPNEILKANSSLLRATLRGMFNTDGGVGLDRRKVYKKPYIRINYTSASEKLMNQLHDILIDLKIPHSLHVNSNPINKCQVIQINGENNVKLFIDNIGFSNPRHLNKVKYLVN
jgi:intein/homing endonuclease